MILIILFLSLIFIVFSENKYSKIVGIVNIIFCLIFLTIDSVTGQGITTGALYHILYMDLNAPVTPYIARLIPWIFLIFLGIYVLKKINLIFRIRLSFSNWLLVGATLLNPLLFETAYISGEFFKSLSTNIVIEDYIKNPEITLENKRDIIFINIESLESHIFDEILSNDSQLASRLKPTFEFSNIESGGGLDWTVAGHLAINCGMPMVTFVNGYEDSLFYPTARCVSDILSEQGYSIDFLLGSDSSFGGLHEVYRLHGAEAIIDVNQLAKMGFVGGRTLWGFDDATVFEAAKVWLANRSISDHPVSLYMATVDTHAPTGHLNKNCTPLSGMSQLESAYICTLQELSNFLGWLASTKRYKDALVIVTGDHLSMANPPPFKTGITSKRTVSFKIYDQIPSEISSLQYNQTRKGSTVDIGSTVLSWLTNSDVNLGLGRNLLGKNTNIAERFDNFSNFYYSVYSQLVDAIRIGQDSNVNIVNEKYFQVENGKNISIPFISSARGNFSIYAKGRNTSGLKEFLGSSDVYSQLGEEIFGIIPCIWIEEAIVDEICYFKGYFNGAKLSVNAVKLKNNRQYNLSLIKSFAFKRKFVLDSPNFAAEIFSFFRHELVNKIIPRSFYLAGRDIFRRVRSSLVNISLRSIRKIKEILVLYDTQYHFGDLEIIAHGGGRYAGVPYTNSVEAFSSSARSGFKYIEVDLYNSCSGGLVATHDEFKEKLIDGRPCADLDTVSDSLNEIKFTPLNDERIKRLMLDFPDILLVTDKLENFDIISWVLPFRERVIPEILNRTALLSARKNSMRNLMISDRLLLKEFGNALSWENFYESGILSSDSLGITVHYLNLKKFPRFFSLAKNYGLKIWVYGVSSISRDELSKLIGLNRKLITGIYYPFKTIE